MNGSRLGQALIRCFIGVLVLGLSRPAAAAEEPKPSRFEISLGLDRALSLVNAAYTSSYVPPSAFNPSRASAGQTLKLNGESGSGFDLGFRYFPTRRVGAELRFGYLQSRLGGTNDNYNYSHQFVARGAGPAAVAEIVTHEGALEWPNTEGRLRQMTLALNAVTRWEPAERVVGSVSAGLSLLRIAGGAERLGFTSFQAGAVRSVAVDQYEASFTLDPLRRVGLNAGAEFDFAVARHLAVVVDCRYYYSGKTSLPVHVDRVVSKAPVTKRLGAKEIESALQPMPLELNPSFSRILFGLKYRR